MEHEYRGYKIVGDGTFGMYNVKQMGRGKVQASLRGAFTAVDVARKAIDTVLGKEDNNAKSEGTSGV